MERTRTTSSEKKVDRLTNQPTHFTLLQVDGFPLVSAVSRTLLASQSTHLTKVRYSVLYFTWKPEKTSEWIEDKYDDIDTWIRKQKQQSKDTEDVPLYDWLNGEDHTPRNIT